MNASGPRPPRICFVGLDNLPALAPEFAHLTMGGAQLQQTLLARGLKARGFDVSMVVADLGQPEGATWEGIRTHKAYAPEAGLPVLRFVHPRLTRVWAGMRRAAADIYYCSTAGLLPGQLALYARWARRPVRTVFRMAHDRDARPAELRIPNRRGKALYLYGLPRMDLILAQTESQQAEMQCNLGLPSTVIRSLVEIPALPAAVNRDIDVLWISNLRPFKRPEMFLELARSLPQYRLHMAGGSQPRHEDYYAALEAQARGMASLTFHGPVAYAETNRLLLRARVLVNTSETEGFPNTYLQAWARGIPVVGTFDPDGIIAREGVGIVARNAAELREAVTALLSDEARWLDIGRRCRSYVQRMHGEGAVDQYAKALHALLQTRSQPVVAEAME